MPIDEATRHRLHTHLEEFLGPDDTEALMSCLPPQGWDDVPSKQYIDLKFEALGHQFTGELHKALTRQTAFMLGVLAALFVSFAGVVLSVG